MWCLRGLILVIICNALFVGTAQAADEEAAPEGEEVMDGADAEGEEGEGKSKKTIYIPVKPAFVVNYGGSGKLKYIKADVALRLDSSAAANSVRHHMPYIRNNLVMLFSSQTDESISTQDGKEALRQEGLKEVRNVLKVEDGQEGVVDFYFNNFLIQK